MSLKGQGLFLKLASETKATVDVQGLVTPTPPVQNGG